MSSHDFTAIWFESLGDLKGKDTRRSPEEIMVEHVSLGLSTESMLHVNIKFVQDLPFSHMNSNNVRTVCMHIFRCRIW